MEPSHSWLAESVVDLFSHKLFDVGVLTGSADQISLLLLTLLTVLVPPPVLVGLRGAPQIDLSPQPIGLPVGALPLNVLNLPLSVSPFTLESPDDRKPESPLLFNFMERSSCINELTIGSVVVDDGDEVERV